jgi:hypothetical protein
MILRFVCFISLLIFLPACEKVKEGPVSDPLNGLTTGPVRMELFNQKEAEISFFTPEQLQNFQGQISIEITEQPRHGNISLDPVRKVFVYRANPGWFGTDSARYRVCSPQSCRSAQIFIRLTDTVPPCIPEAPDLTFEVSTGNQVTALPQSFTCGATVSELTENPAPQNISLSANGILTSFPDFTTQNFQLKYRICTSTNLCDTGRITLNIRPDSGFCRSRFLPADDEIFILSNVVRRSIQYDSLYRNDPPTCPDDLIYESLAIVSGPNHGTAELRSNIQGRFVRYTRNPGAQAPKDSLLYSVRSRSGKTALVKLFFKIKP